MLGLAEAAQKVHGESRRPLPFAVQHVRREACPAPHAAPTHRPARGGGRRWAWGLSTRLPERHARLCVSQSRGGRGGRTAPALPLPEAPGQVIELQLDDSPRHGAFAQLNLFFLGPKWEGSRPSSPHRPWALKGYRPLDLPQRHWTQVRRVWA